MQTILGANGQIGQQLARELAQHFTQDIRVVSRNPSKINPLDHVVAANLLDKNETDKAIAGSDIVYLTVGLPMDTKLWQLQWPTIADNVLHSCQKHDAKLVFFDNTYMYPQTSTPQTETSPFKPVGAKGMVRATIAKQVQQAINDKKISGMICRAPEFYGPDKTQSITQTTIIDNLLNKKTAKVFVRDDTLRSLIYTPDASRAMALLGNTADAFGQTWHLPCDDNRLTYSEFIKLAAEVFEVKADYKILASWMIKLAGLFNATIKDACELLPRYAEDNIFVSDKFKQRFPMFAVTSFREGLIHIKQQHDRLKNPKNKKPY